jgi:hypothetical protein
MSRILHEWFFTNRPFNSAPQLQGGAPQGRAKGGDGSSPRPQGGPDPRSQGGLNPRKARS